jgi:hypothetical protein
MNERRAVAIKQSQPSKRPVWTHDPTKRRVSKQTELEPYLSWIRRCCSLVFVESRHGSFMSGDTTIVMPYTFNLINNHRVQAAHKNLSYRKVRLPKKPRSVGSVETSTAAGMHWFPYRACILRRPRELVRILMSERKHRQLKCRWSRVSVQ